MFVGKSLFPRNSVCSGGKLKCFFFQVTLPCGFEGFFVDWETLTLEIVSELDGGSLEIVALAVDVDGSFDKSGLTGNENSTILFLSTIF